MDQATRSSETCSAAWICMKPGRKLNWDSKLEAFVNDDEANAMRSRKARSAEYDIHEIMKKAGI